MFHTTEPKVLWTDALALSFASSAPRNHIFPRPTFHFLGKASMADTSKFQTQIEIKAPLPPPPPSSFFTDLSVVENPHVKAPPPPFFTDLPVVENPQVKAPPPPFFSDLAVDQTLQEEKVPFFKSHSRRPRGDTWLISVFVILHIIAFVTTMLVNDCWRKSYGDCAFKALGRLSFQPLSENPLLGPSASTWAFLGIFLLISLSGFRVFVFDFSWVRVSFSFKWVISGWFLRKWGAKGEKVTFFRSFLRAFVLKLYYFCLIRIILMIGVIFLIYLRIRVFMYKSFGDAKMVFAAVNSFFFFSPENLVNWVFWSFFIKNIDH